MNWVKAIAGAAKEANDAAHGARLKQGFNQTSDNFGKLAPDIQSAVFAAFLRQRAHLSQQAQNWSAEGRIKAGRHLQDEARRKYDFNQSEAYGLWMAGAWLESSARPSRDAQDVHRGLESLARKLILNLRAPPPETTELGNYSPDPVESARQILREREEYEAAMRSQRTRQASAKCAPVIVELYNFTRNAIGAALGVPSAALLDRAYRSRSQRQFECMLMGIATSFAHGRQLTDEDFDACFYRGMELLRGREPLFDAVDPSRYMRSIKRAAAAEPNIPLVHIGWSAAQSRDCNDTALASFLDNLFNSKPPAADDDQPF